MDPSLELKLKELNDKIDLLRFPIPQVLSIAQVAKHLHLSERKVKTLIESGRLSAVNLGTAAKPLYRIEQRAIERLLEFSRLEAAMSTELINIPAKNY